MMNATTILISTNLIKAHTPARKTITPDCAPSVYNKHTFSTASNKAATHGITVSVNPIGVPFRDRVTKRASEDINSAYVTRYAKSMTRLSRAAFWRGGPQVFTISPAFSAVNANSKSIILYGEDEVRTLLIVPSAPVRMSVPISDSIVMIVTYGEGNVSNFSVRQWGILCMLSVCRIGYKVWGW